MNNLMLKMALRALVSVFILCLAAPAAAQKSPFVGETVWGCEGQHSAKKKWKKVPGASHYQVKTEDSDWRDVEDDNYTFDLEKDKLTYLYVRPVINGNPGEESSVLVRQTGEADRCQKAGPYGWNYIEGGWGLPSEIPEGMVVIDGRLVWIELIQTCLTLPPSIVVSGTAVGAQCRQVGAAGVGLQRIIDQGVIDAVDIWGYVTPGIEVCFQNRGALILLDAATSPRQVVALQAYQRDGMTCATIDRAGTVVLIGEQPQEQPSLAAQPQSDSSPPAQPQSDSSPLAQPQGCRVTTTTRLTLRSEPPDGDKLAVLPVYATYATSAWQNGFYRVRHRQIEGWISADYVTLNDECRQSSQPQSDSSPPAQLQGCRVTTTTRLTLRSKPPDGDKLAVLPANTTYAASEWWAGFYKVQHQQSAGWISANYVILNSECLHKGRPPQRQPDLETQLQNAANPPTRLQNCRIITATRLTLRSAPPDGEKLAVLPANETYATSEWRNGFYKIQHFQTEGWISANYVTLNNECRQAR